MTLRKRENGTARKHWGEGGGVERQAIQEAPDLHFRSTVFEAHVDSHVQVLGKRQKSGRQGRDSGRRHGFGSSLSFRGIRTLTLEIPRGCESGESKGFNKRGWGRTGRGSWVLRQGCELRRSKFP